MENTPLQDDEVIVKTNFIHKINLDFKKDATVLELKTKISQNFLIREDEYELFLGNNPISPIYNKTLLSTLVDNYKSTDFNIKSYKNIFDLKKQLIDYNEFLDKNILLKEQEIKDFTTNYQQMLNELKEIDETDALESITNK